MVVVAGRTILIGTARAGGSGNLIAVVDGAVTNVYSCLRTSAPTFEGRNYSAGLIVFTNLPDTMHTVVLTAQTAANTFLCWVAGYSRDPGPVVALCGTEKSPSFMYGQLAPFDQGSDAAAEAYSGMVSNTAALLAATGLNVSWTNAPGFDTNTDYEPDFLHPNGAGHRLLAQNILPLLSGFTVLSPPVPLTQYPGTTASFAVATAGADLEYRWQANTGGGFVDVSTGTGGMTSNYTTAPLSLADNGTLYQCVITAGCGPALTNGPVALAVTAGPAQGLLFPPSLLAGGPNWQLTLVGSPGYVYALDWTHSLTPPIVWLPLATNNADANGWVLYTNAASGAPADFYRVRGWE
jgi:hypothetical protein